MNENVLQKVVYVKCECLIKKKGITRQSFIVYQLFFWVSKLALLLIALLLAFAGQRICVALLTLDCRSRGWGKFSSNNTFEDMVFYLWLFHDRGSYYVETSPLICRANKWTGFYMIGTSVKKKLVLSLLIWLVSLLDLVFYTICSIAS